MLFNEAAGLTSDSLNEDFLTFLTSASGSLSLRTTVNIQKSVAVTSFIGWGDGSMLGERGTELGSEQRGFRLRPEN